MNLFHAEVVEGSGCIPISSIASLNFIPGTTSNSTCMKGKKIISGRHRVIN
jgi:hypothetical protein